MTTQTTNEVIWNFPCDFPIKIVGRANPEFEVVVLSIIRKHAPDLREGSLEFRSSKNGNYVAITVTVQATSKDQLDAIYQDLSSHELVLAAY